MGSAAAFVAGAAAGAAVAGAVLRHLARERSERSGRLLSFAMHEVNTPVTAVNMTIINLLTGVFGEVPPDQVKWLEMTRDQVGRLNAIVGEIRDLVHLELGRELRTTVRPADPAEIVDDALASLRAGFRHAGIALETELAQGLPRVATDQERASRSLVSLLYHARKFRAGGPVTLRVRRAGPGVVCEVEYAGSRLPPGEAEASLDLYYPARARRDQVLCATGLGLGLVREILRRVGGELAVSSEDGGRTRLTMTLPAAEAS